MAVTLEQIGGYFEKMDLDYKHMKERDVIVSGVGNGSVSSQLYVRTREDGALLSIQMEPLEDDKSGHFDIPSDSEHINLILPQLLKANYETKFGTWEYDPTDGDLRFAVEIPFEDALMTFDQFKRIVSMFFTALDTQKSIMHTFKTGEVLEDDGGMEDLVKEAFADAMIKFLKDKVENKKDDEEDGI